jgi:tRNA dimethylallyltransferase
MAKVSNQKPVPVILGPTASGKTAVALTVAKLIGGEIISADARQIYKYLNVGTAKPAQNEMIKIRHHFVDELLPDQDFNAGEFGKLGRKIVTEICQRGNVPIVVGGSGLYIQALIDGFFEGPPADPSVRGTLMDRLKKEGPDVLLRELQRIDPEAASKVLATNTRRIIRALEVYTITGEPISKLQKTRSPEKLKVLMTGLEWERKILYKRIDERVEYMVHAGLVDEVKDLIKRDYSPNLNSLQTVGYVEVFKYLNGEFSFERMIQLIKQNSRRYAKRQMTWFRKDKRIKWFSIKDESELEEIGRKIAGEYNGY